MLYINSHWLDTEKVCGISPPKTRQLLRIKFGISSFVALNLVLHSSPWDALLQVLFQNLIFVIPDLIRNLVFYLRPTWRNACQGKERKIRSGWRGRGHLRVTKKGSFWWSVATEESRFCFIFVTLNLFQSLFFCFSIGVSREMCSLDLEALSQYISGWQKGDPLQNTLRVRSGRQGRESFSRERSDRRISYFTWDPE